MTDTQITLPAERFFWARLDAGSLPRQRRRDRQALGYLLEAHLPVPVDEVQTAFAPITGSADHFIACGMRKDALAETLRDRADALTLVPETWPKWLDAAALSMQRLNLLHGAFEPRTLRKARRHALVVWMSLMLACAALLCIGLTRRTAAIRKEIAAIQDARHQVMASVVPAGGGGVSSQPPELRMLAELRSLRQTRGELQVGGGSGPLGHRADVVESFAQLVAAWPRDLHVRTESVLITPTTMTLRGFVATSDDVQSLANALATLRKDEANALIDMEGVWLLQQPQISVTKPDEVSATLQWRHEPGDKLRGRDNGGRSS